MNYCLKGKELLLLLQRAEWLPLYDEEGVRTIIREINDLYNKVLQSVPSEHTVETLPESLKGSTIYYYQCLSRNKRCLLAYLVYRLEKIRSLKWEAGSVVPTKLRTIMSDRESDYFMEYNRLVTDYCRNVGLDLTSDLEPPKELYIEVRAVHDCGELLTYYGLIKLDRDTTHYVRRSDVEHLIRQGSLVQISMETGV